MKVYIGPHTTWIGPYQIAEKILFWEDFHESERVQALGNFLAHGFKDEKHKTWLYRLCNWIDSRKYRKVSVRIDRCDTWSADQTLALVIVPTLKKLKETKYGAPHVDDEDVPENLRTEAAPALSEEQIDTGCTDENWFKRWDWVLGEMIWSFEQHAEGDWEQQYYKGEPDIQFEKIENSEHYELVKGPDDTFEVDREGIKAHSDRMDNGRRLFAKYYGNLWS